MPRTKSKVISVRLPEYLFNLLQDQQRRAKADGEDKTVSDIARERIERATDVLKPTGLYDLMNDEAGTLFALYQAIQNDWPLRRLHWEFLAVLAHRAYLLSPREKFRSDLLTANIRAFLEVLRLRHTRMTLNEDDYGYFRSKLQWVMTDPDEKRGYESVRNATTRILSDISGTELCNPGAEMITRNLEVALRDDIGVPDTELYAALKPYARALLTLAAKAHYERSVEGHPNRVPYVSVLRVFPEEAKDKIPFSKTFKSGVASLMVSSMETQIYGQLTIEMEWTAASMGFAFPDLDVTLLTIRNRCKSEMMNFFQGRPGQYPDMLVWGASGGRWYLSPAAAVDMDTVIEQYLKEPWVIAQRSKLEPIYGAI